MKSGHCAVCSEKNETLIHLQTSVRKLQIDFQKCCYFPKVAAFCFSALQKETPWWPPVIWWSWFLKATVLGGWCHPILLHSLKLTWSLQENPTKATHQPNLSGINTSGINHNWDHIKPHSFIFPTKRNKHVAISNIPKSTAIFFLARGWSIPKVSIGFNLLVSTWNER